MRVGGKTFKPIPEDDVMKLIKAGRWIAQINDLLEKQEKESNRKWTVVPVIVHEDVLHLCDMKLKERKSEVTLNQIINDLLIKWLGLLSDWEEDEMLD
jgi:hypothetical protein